MAIRIIRKKDDPDLRKKCSEVKEITPQIIAILEDMAETMYYNDGVGLAANQVGIPKQLVVIDLMDDEGLIELVNPKIIQVEGKEVEAEGCLSFPGIVGEVVRAKKVTVEALNREGKKIKVTGSGLFARALQHELDHLEGKLFVDKVIRFLEPSE
ncbi:peptide deformylase [Candidatus Contubernalis alkaliaceticus]|uniref:peptide deformylase n=1 Tax=Candidatus Contubernalis alkaliaceticus TaxID=338645 RepID=UPI001F4BFF1C|nr:peptide deformylase [Candidatus Contubernalis alkalaceticus]UNC92786.1 peptide deformylase [Candidatus Contubernalis alkalaceticus]